MAATSNESSRQRDPVVDANPDLTRKRQRLSEEIRSTTPSSSHSSVATEAVDIKSTYSTTDASNLIVEDEIVKMDRYSHNFSILDDANLANNSPIRQIQTLIRHIEGRQSLPPAIFGRLSAWIKQHIDETRHESPWRTVYSGDQEFFGGLGQLTCTILSSDDLFTEEETLKFGQAPLAALVTGFLRGALELSARIVDFLPDVVGATIARRDSGQIRGQQKLDLLWHVQVLDIVLSGHNDASLIDLQNQFDKQPDRQLQFIRANLRKNTQTMDALLQLLQKLCQCHRDIALTWNAIGAIFSITQVLDLSSYELADQFMEAAHLCVLPIIRQKHPRALPDGFHERFVSASQSVLENLLCTRPNEVWDFYCHFVKSDADALLPQTIPNESWNQTLQIICHAQNDIAVELLKTCWVFQALKSFIFSDIMDVRGCGISQLGKRLADIHQTYQKSLYGLDHPILQFAARFLRSNEFTKYIFGPNSHANLVSHSQNIFGFLAAMHAYTDVDTDIIWNACTTSVEAEFVKASFDILVDLTRHLEWDRLLYLATKYVHTAPEKLGKDAVESLEFLLKKLSATGGNEQSSQAHLATAFLSIDILRQHYSRHDSKILSQLCQIAMAELTRFAYGDRFSLDGQVLILGQCIPHLVKPSDYVLSSAMVVVLFLKKVQNPSSLRELAGKPLVSEIATEMIRYIKCQRDEPASRSPTRMASISHRIEVVLRLMAISNIEIDQEIVRTLFDHCFAGSAVDMITRDDAWIRLRDLTLDKTTPYFSAFMFRLLSYLFRDEIPKMVPQDFSAASMEMLYRMLVDNVRSEQIRLEFDHLLDLPMWSKLVDIAELACEPRIREIAIMNMSMILFDMPYMQTSSKINQVHVESCHTRFIQERIDRLHSSYALIDSSPADTKQLVLQQIDLLSVILNKSKITATGHNQSKPLEICLAADATETNLSYTLELFVGLGPKYQSIAIKAAPSAKVSDLVVELPAITNTVDNRIILSGREVDQANEADKLLKDIGIQPSRRVAVCPRYNFNSDISFTYGQIGVVERELVQHYDRLEILLHGPPAIAHKVSQFLRNLQCPMPVRRRVVSPTATIDDLFPQECPAKTALSIHILGVHFRDFCKLGVVNDGFVVHTIGVLVALLVDSPRLPTEILRCQALSCLNDFLNEHLNDDVSSDLVENPTAFADAMIGILLTSLTPRPNQGLDGLRMETAKLCYKALLGVFDRQRSFWEAFAANELAVDIHSRILLNDNLHQIAGQIITFCDQTTNTAIPDFYLHVMTSILPQTLKHGTRARSFYQFAQDLLFRVGALNVRTDEKKARDLVDLLLTLALNYEHSETVDLPITDCAMLGVLKILHSALNILKAFKRPLLLNNISVKVFQTLLFPLNAGEYDRTLLHQESRRLAFGIVEMTCESRDAFSDLCSAMLDVLQPSKRYVLEYICYADWAREASACAGLDNLGMTCYMNSLIQQLYANVHFRQFIFETPLLDKEKQACLAQIQILFARMQTQADRSIRPIELARTLNIRTDSQEDVHGFYEDFLSRLETEMPDAASKTALNQFFTGRLLSQIKGECGHVSTRTEPFVDLPVLVKNKPGLKESLDEFVQGEPMEGANKYKCLACDPMGEGRLVDAMKRACPEMIPDNLTFCLKRFSFEAMFNMDDKVNDKFEFPQTIDMSSYHHKKVEDPSLICAADPFELVGVIVHQGTLQFGHYWSYTLLRNTPESTSRVWVRLEDKNAHICPDGFETVQRECTGGEWFTNGQERTDNAYVLFYQRKSVLEETLSVVKPARDPLTGDLLPARIKLPEALELTLRDENRDHYLANHVAHLDFSVFASWLVENLHRFTENSPATSESGDSEGDVSPKDSATSVGSVATQLEMSVAGVVVALIQRLATCDSDPLTKLQCITDRLCSTIDKKPSLAHPFLARILQDGSWTRLLVIDGRNMRRLGLAHIVQLLLLALRETDELTYRSMFVKLCDQLEVIFELKRENAFQFNWNSAFEMVGWMASKGAWETAQILRHSFLRFALDMLYLPWSEQLQAEVPYALQFMKRRTPQVTSLYRFITFVLGQPWIRMHNTDHDDRKVVDLTDDGTAVVPPDLVKCLHGVSTACPMSFWMRSAILADRNHQENFPPAKLMSLLLTSDHVPEIVKASIPRSLELYIDTEEESLNPVLYLVEEFCAACNDDTRASQAMRQLVKTIPLWERCDAAFANFIVRVNNIASRAVAENLGVWYSSYIGPNSNTNKPAKICNDVAQWLRCTFFGVTSLVDDEFEGTRVRLARKMIRDLVPKIQYAYEHEQPRSRCEPAITVLEGVSEYLDQLQSYMSATSGRSASEALKAEYQELDADVADLWGLKSILGEWEMDSPTQFVTVNDIASEGSVISEEDEDIEPSGWIDDEDTGAGG